MKLNKVFLKRRLYYTCDIDLKKYHLQHPSDRPHLQLPSTTAALAAALPRVVATLRQPRIDTGGLGGGGVGVAGGRGQRVAGGGRAARERGREARGRGREDVLEEDVLEEDVLEEDVLEKDVSEEDLPEEDVLEEDR